MDEPVNDDINKNKPEEKPGGEITNNKPGEKPGEDNRKNEPEEKPAKEIGKIKSEEKSGEDISNNQPEEKPGVKIINAQAEEKPGEDISNNQPEEKPGEDINKEVAPLTVIEEKNPDEDVNRQIRRRTIKALAFWGAAAIVAPVVIFKWLRSRPDDNGVQAPFRKVLDANARIFQKFVSDSHLVKTYPREMALKDPRTNGDEGLKDDVGDLGDYKITIANFNQAPFQITMEDIKALPKHDVTYSFKCIEGWDMITNWSGALLSDFVAKYKLGTHSGKEFDKNNPHDLAEYVGMETPDGGYYIGLDIASALHPQTILCYEMNGEELPEDHGGPLRLIIPTKYGIKNLKRIGKIFFTDTRPRDYWFEQGYDYFAGL